MRRLHALRRIFSQACADRAVEQGRRKRLRGVEGLRVSFQNGSEYAELRFAFESAASGNHFVENASKAEEIAACVRFASLQNFRRHVLKSSNDRTFLCERRGSRGERGQIHCRCGGSEWANGLGADRQLRFCKAEVHQ